MKESEPSLTLPHVTLVISHRVPEEKKEAFAELQETLARKLQTFEGFLGMESTAPTDGFQENWMTIYRFQHAQALEKWTESPEQKQIVEQIKDLIGSVGNIQVLAEQQDRKSVTTVFAHRIKKGREEDYRDWRKKILKAQREFDGFLGVECFDPIQGVSDQWVDIGHFTHSEAREAWMKSEVRLQLVKELEPLAEDVSVNSVNSGLDAWFRGGSSKGSAPSPPPWKQAMAVWLALYPTVMLLTFYFNPLLGSISMPLMMLIGNAASVILLTWVVMKWVNKKDDKI